MQKHVFSHIQINRYIEFLHLTEKRRNIGDINNISVFEFKSFLAQHVIVSNTLCPFRDIELHFESVARLWTMFIVQSSLLVDEAQFWMDLTVGSFDLNYLDSDSLDLHFICNRKFMDSLLQLTTGQSLKSGIIYWRSIPSHLRAWMIHDYGVLYIFRRCESVTLITCII